MLEILSFPNNMIVNKVVERQDKKKNGWEEDNERSVNCAAEYIQGLTKRSYRNKDCQSLNCN